LSPRTAELIRAEAARFGSIAFDRYVELALYGIDGFFARGLGAGSRRDFVTSPEVGPLFGALVARAFDRHWQALGEPDPFVVVEAGAGNGRLCREVLRAEPACGPALRYVLVERSAALRTEQSHHLPVEPPDEALGAFVATDPESAPAPVARLGPIVTSLDQLPSLPFEGVVFANELLDNLPFGLAEWDGDRWLDVRVDADLRAVLVPLVDPHALATLEPFGTPPPGTRAPVPVQLDAWLAAAARCVSRGPVVLVDYCVAAGELVARGNDWLRTYRGQERGADPFETPGERDITADVVLEQVAAAARRCGLGEYSAMSQAEWLRQLGIDDLVADGKRIWAARAAVGDVVALEGRSRATQAAVLTDRSAPGALGNHTVLTFPQT